MAHYEGKRYGCSCPDGTCDMNCQMYRIAAGKPSNADRIRSMTDEELADEFLTAFAAFYDVEWSKDAVLDWLKQEVSTNG